MGSQNLTEAQKFKFFPAEVIETSQNKSKLQRNLFFIFAPRLDFGYASKPENSPSDPIQCNAAIFKELRYLICKAFKFSY
jgi:hypothetical protein